MLFSTDICSKLAWRAECWHGTRMPTVHPDGTLAAWRPAAIHCRPPAAAAACLLWQQAVDAVALKVQIGERVQAVPHGGVQRQLARQMLGRQVTVWRVAARAAARGWSARVQAQ